MRQALIETATGKVVNVIALEADSTWTPPVGHTVIKSNVAGVGDTYRNRKFTKPPVSTEPTPEDLARAEFAAADTKGKLAIIGKQLGLAPIANGS